MVSPVGFAVTVRFTAEPPASVEGAPVTVSQLSAALIELTVSVPPPVFCRPTLCEEAARLELNAENVNRLLVSVNWGAGAETTNDTVIVWVVPAQELGVRQLTGLQIDRAPGMALRMIEKLIKAEQRPEG